MSAKRREAIHADLSELAKAFLTTSTGDKNSDVILKRFTDALTSTSNYGVVGFCDTAPLKPLNDAKYIVSINATGLFEPYKDHIALWDAAKQYWEFVQPTKGQVAVVGGEAYIYLDGWQPYPSGEGMATEEAFQLHIGDTEKHVSEDERIAWNAKSDLALAVTVPAALGNSAVVGTGTTAARSDHVHPLPSAADIGAATISALNTTNKNVTNLTTRVSTAEGEIDALTASLADKADAADLSSHADNTTVHITAAERTTWNAKADKSYADTVASTACTNLLGTWNTWTNGNKFSRTVEFGAYGLIDNMFGGCKLSGFSTVAKTDGAYIPRLRLVTGSETTRPSLYFYTYDESAADAQLVTPTAMFYVDGSKNPAHTGFFNGITCYKNIRINNGLQVDLQNYAAQENPNLHTALHGVYENNSNAVFENYSSNDFYGGLYTRGYTFCNFANNHPVFPNSIGWLRGTTVMLDGTTVKYASSIKSAGLIIDNVGRVKYYKSSASAAGDMADDTWAPVTDQSHDAELTTKGYLDKIFKRLQSTDNTVNNNATSVVLASQASSTINDGAGVSMIAASGACEITAPTGGQTTAFNSILSSANSKTSGASRHCVILGSQGVEVTDHLNGGIYYGYKASASASSANLQFSVAGAGVVTAKEFVTANTADYAEFFENETRAIIPLGTLVTLNGDKIKIASDGDEIVGVITATQTPIKNSDKTKFSGTPTLVGGDTPYTWGKRYLTGEFGETLFEEVQSEETPEETIVQEIQNPEYDPKQNNIPRSERPEEWSCVGLLGQVYVRIDDTVRPNGYLFAVNGMGSLSETRTNLRCMRITKPFDVESGYGVALCLLK